MASLTSNFINTGNPDPNPDTIPIEYNYRTLGRKDTMLLDTLNNNDFPIKPFKKLDTKRDWSTNLYNLDIEGSSPRRIGAFNQKIDFINKNDDIEKSCPKILHYPLNKPEYNLRNDDIELSWPKCVELNTTRCTNPLEPKYNLPKTEPYPFDVPKFIRNSIPCDDIDGAKPRKIISKWQPRETMKKDDIENSWPKKPYIRKTKYNNIDYRDVTHTEFQTGRMTNPLEPVYKLSYLNGDKMVVGPIEKNKPVVFSKYHYDPAFNLKTDDIWGTQTGTKNFINKFNGSNYGYTTLDIKGAQKDTKKKGIITERFTNPLRPKYKYPGYEELKAGGNQFSDPYGRYINKSGANTTIGGKRLPELFVKKESNNNRNIHTIENNKLNNKKTIKINDNNCLIIADLNNSHDIQKIRNSNNITQNLLSNNNMNNTKERAKKINNEKYCSNTYNTNKNKIKKGNKAINNVLGKILKINIVEKSKDKKEKENLTTKDINKKNEEVFNHKIFSIRNTYCEGESKIYQKQKLKLKSKERKAETGGSKKTKIFNPKSRFLILNPYNYHKFTMSTDIKNNHTQIDIRAKKNNTSKNADIIMFDINRGNKSVRQDFCLNSMKKVVPSTKNATENTKINSSSTNKYNNILSNNKLNNDFQDYTLKTETNEVLHTDLGINSLEISSKLKFKMNKNLFKMESKLSSKDTNKTLKNTLYKNQNTGIYSSNNLKHLKINNGIIIKNICQNILNEEKLTSNRKKNFKRKFNNLSNNNNFHHSENKVKKFNKIFTQKKIDPSNISNITNSYSSKINNDLIFKSNFVNYNNNINSSKERKKITSKTKSLKNEKILNFSNKIPLCFLEDYTSSIDYDTKNNINNNNIYNSNTVQAIKKANITNNNQKPGKYIRQIRKNNNYIHIKKRQLKTGNDIRNKSKSINNKRGQKSISSDEPHNIKDSKLFNNLNTMRNPFHQINKNINLNRKIYNKNKINLKKNNIIEENGSNTNSANPLVNIRNTFISFHMYPKYYLDPKKQLSTPKIVMTSPPNLKNSKKLNSNLKINSKKKFTSLTNNNYNHIRQNTSPSIESPLKKIDINNFMNIQQNIYNNMDNQKLFYYTNTEYNDNTMSKNINLDTMKNMKTKVINKKYKTIYRETSSNNKMNSLNGNANININNKIMSNTISPTNMKKFNNKINININNIDNKNIAEYNKTSTNMNTNNNNIKFNENSNKSNNYLTRYVMSGENELNNKKKEFKLIEPSHDFNFLKKPNLTSNIEKGICNTTTNKNANASVKYGIKYKTQRRKPNCNNTNQ